MSLLRKMEAIARRSNDEAHVRVGREWMTCAEYRGGNASRDDPRRKLYETLAPHLAWARVGTKYQIVWIGTRQARVIPYGASRDTVMGVTFNDFLDWYGLNKEAVNG